MNAYRTILAILGFSVIASNGLAENQVPIASEKRAHEKELHSDKSIQQQAQRTAALIQPLIYVPPMRGAPATSRLIGGGTRSFGREYPSLAVLAPSHTGLTSRRQPALYWHISKSVEEPLEFVLISSQSAEPILQTKLDAPIAAGVQKLSLADYDVTLEIGVEYQWSIALVPNPEMRSYDIVTSGKIKRVERDKMLESRLAASVDNLHTSVFAQSGLWYDAIQAVSDQIDAHPGDQRAKEGRAQLLEQVGLTDVTMHERTQSPTRPKLRDTSPVISAGD